MRVFPFILLISFMLHPAVPVLAQSSGNVRTDPTAQSSPQTPAAQPSPQAPAQSAPQPALPPSNHRTLRHTPCWKVAGIAPEVVNQRWQIEDNAKGKISALCSDPALTPEKKRERIHQIDEQTAQEVAKIIPAEQLAAFKACQAERDQEKAKRKGATAQKELGPCGGVIPAQPGDPQHSQHQPSNPPNQ
jgi:hypothetical protein